MIVLHDLLHWTGGDNGASPWYLEWSGFVGNITIFGSLVYFFKKHICHVKGCTRLAKHTVEGTPYIVCAKHHPDLPKEITYTHIYKAHKKHKEK